MRLAPAVERPGIHLGVWRDSEQFVVWGATRNVPPFCLVLEVIAHGLLVVKHSRHESEKFANLAVLHGDEIKVIDESFTHLPDSRTYSHRWSETILNAPPASP
jgi:hypothetical protein